MQRSEFELEEMVFYELESMDAVDGGNDQLIPPTTDPKYRKKSSITMPNFMRKQVTRSAGNYSEHSDGG